MVERRRISSKGDFTSQHPPKTVMEPRTVDAIQILLDLSKRTLDYMIDATKDCFEGVPICLQIQPSALHHYCTALQNNWGIPIDGIEDTSSFFILHPSLAPKGV